MEEAMMNLIMVMNKNGGIEPYCLDNKCPECGKQMIHRFDHKNKIWIDTCTNNACVNSKEKEASYDR